MATNDRRLLTATELAAAFRARTGRPIDPTHIRGLARRGGLPVAGRGVRGTVLFTERALSPLVQWDARRRSGERS